MTDATRTAIPTLSHEIAGTGPPIVFIHAFPLNRRMWGPQVEDLRTVARVIAVDLPGFGQTPPVPTATIGEFAEAVVGILDRYAINRAVVVGCSMGGYVAQALALHSPSRVVALGLADTRARPDSPEVRARRESLVALVRIEGMAPVPDRQLPKLLGRRGAANPKLVDLVREIISQATPQGIITAARAMATRPDFTPLLSQIVCPTAVIVGTEDAIIPVEEAEAMVAALPHGKFVPVQGAGHLANLEAPEQFAGAMRWLLEASALQ